ncbi:hypothetical protein A3J20_01810 [Candidatus Gottesmanbacteria bacterium RIFCSPLOWO2_02_FULL_42_29]|uniref:Uncharacterized protein n=2 Tax=Candidatus Gottesmaniibacteriota TaxID=1752720 RepID=A0A1F6BDJ9_9BACT|nr:MAG: hypothetical protein UV09_C0002G0006 [Candidatus Gottesmanbacteria bacterium GW2011_GWA2_42_18]OGG12189.1 MAG: hypothetical protein A2781_04695 [Candidatus Gottesmanbacteria bacterium RIFCSPHIGHO2_01_FULL_42_27]OGG19917.1 MAG: hypothetical protein A3E72_02775 [Candidatus Gottesmanbacteria bacterium RIFCSPHIGHO2_12_FULL_43_26]OGG33070.1 MAG: hypothetical protein A3G68_00040 [Candidatus Gottesmanbacteria bacterium RIFCSPLOWO2_12_FULL_42_10]OGG35014.1 MAG: hypothetical protein A2968_00060 
MAGKTFKQHIFWATSFNQILITGLCFLLVFVAFLYTSYYSPTSQAASPKMPSDITIPYGD